MTRKRVRFWVYGSLAVILIGCIGWWWLRFGSTGEAGSADRDNNGLWMRRHWLHGGASAEVTELRAALRTLGISRVYPFLGPMDTEGWPGWRDDGVIHRYQPQTAAAFLVAMEESEVQVIPWTGGVLDRDVRLTDKDQRAAFVAHMAQITALGADGVHINVEPMPSFSEGYLDLLRETKEAIGPDKILSVAAYPPTTLLHPVPEVHWTLDFTREVCLVADELVEMAYDTALRVPVLYETLVASWTAELIDTLPPPIEGGCQWSIGVPAYEDDEPWHRPDVETLEHGINGVLRGVQGRDLPGHFTGIAIYASWTTDVGEWAVYERLWRGREPSGITVPDGAR